jgi:hypothetical protein
MEKTCDNKMAQLGYNQLVCDVFTDWESVKDELLVPDRKTGSGNGTIHVFLGAADAALREEFAAYYESVENGVDPIDGAIEVKHYFSVSNIISMLGYVSKYYFEKKKDASQEIWKFLSDLQNYKDEAGLLSTTSLFKLSVGSSRPRPYFKQFESNGVFSHLIRRILLQDSSYKISLYKNEEGEYAAYWLIGFKTLDSFEADPNSESFGKKDLIDSFSLTDQISQYLRCMRTKPFLLLAGISGTGKSRIVKQFAYDSCPSDKGLDADPTSPGNYCLIEVKPNWHDSTELLGYESALNKSYHLTPFVKFLVKAMCHPHVPFFVCLDEMNLAPVEQYFAEFLSVLESRKTQIGIITSEPLIEASIFKNYKDQLAKEFGISEDPKNPKQTDEYQVLNERIYSNLMRDGLRLPPNLIVIGTVNMDETTHQFSRKVIDRAMTIEMNIGEGTAPFQQFFDGYQELGYRENPLPAELFLPTVTSADEALRKKLKAEDAEFLKQNVPTLLNDLNTALNNTPFKVAYRVQNELVLYFAALRQDYPDKLAEELLRQAMDDILMMKVLPRIQGDEDMLEIPLKSVAKFTDSHNYSRASEKIKEMNGRLEPQHFTSFWP